MNLEEFRTRFDELRRMRGFVVRPAWGDRIIELVGEYLDGEVEQEPQAPEPKEASVGDEHFLAAPRNPVFEVMTEIAAHNERMPTKPQVPAEGLRTVEPPAGESDSTRGQEGEPTSGAVDFIGDRSETGPAEDLDVRQPPAGESDSTRSQDQEPEKPCRSCGETKPLSEFGKNAALKDGHMSICKPCMRDRQRRNREKQKVTQLPRQEHTPAPPPEKKKVEKKARTQFCGNGDECVAVDDLGGPTKLNSRNASGICGPCEEHERSAGLMGRFAGHTVRRHKDGSTGA